MKKILIPILLAALLLVLAIPQPAFAHDTSDANHQNQQQQTSHRTTTVAFHIRLVGKEQVPPVTIKAFGRADVRLINNANALQFRLTVCDIANVTMAHIHVGASGKNGPVILFLYHMHDPLFSSIKGCHVLSSGTLHPSDLIPSSANGINNWTDFVNALLSGNTYVNVHTSVHPAGEIRGQLVLHQAAHHEDD
jgi:hypothetical protein